LASLLRDPYFKIRKLALQRINRLSPEMSYQTLQPLTLEDEFWERSINEKEDVYKIMARAAPEKMMPVMIEILSGSSWFLSTRKIDEKVCAIAALSQIRIPESQAIIERNLKSKSKPVKNAAQRALAKMKK
ncbi:hypothetical protein ACFL27_18940, partial [candidate division CSSED10-310 bacterium]